MSISWRDKHTRRVCLDALLVALAMLCSYLETLLPLTAWIPLPGVRLGLANLVVTLTLVLLSAADAAAVSAVRILLTGLLFGSATSLWFSMLGGLFAYLMLVLLVRLGRGLSYLGVSVLCAAAHQCGQMLAAATLFGAAPLLSYLPWLLFASIGCGAAVGALLNLLVPRLLPLRGRLL